MSRIRGKNTVPELIVRKFLFAHGFRFRLHVKSLPGKPDIVLSKYKTIIDVRGCFWHRHKKCKYGDKINSESLHIMNRVKSAAVRDKINVEIWKEMGWKVIILWDCCELEIKKKQSKKRDIILVKLLDTLLGLRKQLNHL